MCSYADGAKWSSPTTARRSVVAVVQWPVKVEVSWVGDFGFEGAHSGNGAEWRGLLTVCS